MENQLALELDEKTRLQELFDKYDAEHPEVYIRFVNLAKNAKKRNHKRFSARGLLQVMRYYMDGNIKADGYKLNNNLTPYLVRKMTKEYPDFEGFFEKRTLKSV